MEEIQLPALTRRMRRLRVSDTVRDLVQETHVRLEDLVMPLFARDGYDEPEPINSMPGVCRFSRKDVVEECQRLSKLGIRAIALFPVIASDHKDPQGSIALSIENPLFGIIRAIKAECPELLIITDVALDPYTSHGHDGLLNEMETDVDNDATLRVLAKLAVLQAQAGADWVAPSDMMDGRVAAIRAALDLNGFTKTSILAYSAKFASAYYGPFREAVGSQQVVGRQYLTKKSYQLNPANPREALLDADLDEQEGADLLMVKPGGPYLDIIHRLRERSNLPIVAYQVSGEYSQIHAAAKMNWLDYKSTRDEALLALKRAGADLIISYFAQEIAQEIADGPAKEWRHDAEAK